MHTKPSNSYLSAARRAIQTGQKVEAQRYLKLALRDDPKNVTAWLWLAGITPSAKEARGYIARAEMLQPNHPALEKAKKWVDKKYPHSTPITTPPQPTAKQQIPAANQPKQKSMGQKRPFFPSTTLLLQGSMVAIMILLLGGVGWLVWQQLSLPQRATDAQPVISQAIIESGASASIATPQAILAKETAVPTTTPTPIQIAAKNISQHSQSRATWTITPTPSPTSTPTPTVQPTFINPDYNSDVRPFGVSNSERWIDVNLTTQTVIAYEGDTAVYNALVSSGTWEHPTVTGQFRIWLRYESQTMDGALLGYDYYLENVPYVMYFYQDYAIHGAYWHNNFGTPMSHGCVNVHPTDAGWLFNWASIGTLVNVHY